MVIRENPKRLRVGGTKVGEKLVRVKDVRWRRGEDDDEGREEGGIEWCGWVQSYISTRKFDM